MLLKILKAGFILLFCLTPFVFTKFNSELFEYNKMMLVYLLTVITAGTWILRMISEKRLIWKRTILDIPLALFLISQLISTIISIDIHTSIWGYYSRSNGGLLSVISFIVLYFAFVSNFESKDVLKFLKASVVAGAFVALYAIPEHFGASFSCLILEQGLTVSCWVQDVQARVFGTLGQPNWLAAYLSMLIFPAIYFFITAKTVSKRISYFVLLIAYYLAFTFTYSRGATLGLIAGAAVMGLGVLYSGVRSNDYKNFKLYTIVIIVLLFLSMVYGTAISEYRLLNDPSVPLRPTLSESGSSGTQLENGGTESGKIRLIVWNGALDIFRAFPIFGSGVETFAYAYYQFRPPEHNMVSEWDFLYNKAHNEYLNYLATTGAFGFLSYIAVIIVFLLWVMRYVLLIKPKELITHNSLLKSESSQALLITSLAAGYISFLVQNFFLFSVVTGSLFFYMFPAILFVYFDEVKELSPKNILSRSLEKLFILISRNKISLWIVRILIVLIILIFLNNLLSLWEADKAYKDGSAYNDYGNPGRAYNFLIEAVGLNPGEPLYLVELGNAAGSSAIALAEEDATTSAELIGDSEFFTDLGISISPVNTSVLRTAIRTYFQLSLLDPKYKDKTLEIVNQTIELAPTDPKLLVNKAVILTQFEQIPEAIEAYKKAVELKPDYREARLQLGDLYVKTNQKDLAKQQADYVLEKIPNDPDALKLQEAAK